MTLVGFPEEFGNVQPAKMISIHRGEVSVNHMEHASEKPEDVLNQVRDEGREEGVLDQVDDGGRADKVLDKVYDKVFDKV
jgi:hypothetical protein